MVKLNRASSDCLLRSHQYELACQHYRKAIEIEPKVSEPYINLAYILSKVRLRGRV